MLSLPNIHRRLCIPHPKPISSFLSMLSKNEQKSNVHRNLWSENIRVFSSKVDSKTVNISGVQAPISSPSDPQLVPRGYLPTSKDEVLNLDSLNQETIRHLRWMLQKDALNQDIFLLGSPGPERRRLVMQYCELLQKEVEFVPISRDTTESDLLQRREILRGNSIFVDQAPVRAALNGRVLILDGIEKAERNVLPTLNNLLENREIGLDDGRFLISSTKFDSLIAEGSTAEELNERNLWRVHPDFRVVALGLPVPPYPGRTLDPPLRSRFQARVISPLGTESLIAHLTNEVPELPLSVLQQLVGLSETIQAVEAQQQQLGRGAPLFSQGSLTQVARTMASFPNTNLASAVGRVYSPIGRIPMGMEPDQVESIEKAALHFGISADELHRQSYSIVSIKNNGKTIFNGNDGSSTSVQLPVGPMGGSMEPLNRFVETDVHHTLLVQMLQDHLMGKDICLVGEKGSGKSAMVKLFSKRVGLPTEVFPLFKEMTARDLLQRRVTDAAGNTIWVDSPLVLAAKLGHIAVLDGVDRISADILTTLQRLTQDREFELPDGSLLQKNPQSDITGDGHKMISIHPSFRIIALGNISSSKNRWMSPETSAMFALHKLKSLGPEAYSSILREMFPSIDKACLEKLSKFSEHLTSNQAGNDPITLSIRQLLRICSNLQAFPACAEQNLPRLVEDALMLRFMPDGPREVVEQSLKTAMIESLHTKRGNAVPEYLHIDDQSDVLRIGDIKCIKRTPQRPELVPSPLFYDNPTHTNLLKDMLADYAAGEKAMLVIGNQGVGKNKLVDRLLQLLQAEREYIQLHRDTTVGSLTLVPALEAGRVVYQDSPLIRAVRHGRVLLVDEADKAPLEVVVLLKNLVEDGEMLLADGRRIMRMERVQDEHLERDESVICIHPDFKLWVLANRPGFPFLGNDFFRECGDVFSVHAVDNPDVNSEVMLLSKYAPNLPSDLLRKVAQAFSDLRDMHYKGVMAYPYSIREAVAVIKHMNQYPDEGAIPALRNALSFDSFDQALWEMLAEVFNRNGVPLGSDPSVGLPRPRIDLAETKQLPPFIPTSDWSIKYDAGHPVEIKHFSLYTEDSPATATTSHYNFIPSRTTFFSEENGSIWLDEGVKGRNATPYFHAVGLTKLVEPQTKEESLHVLTTKPLELHSFFNLGSGRGRRVKTEILGTGWDYYSEDKFPLVAGVDALSMVAVLLPKTNLLAMVDPNGGDTGFWMELFPKRASSALNWIGGSREPQEPTITLLDYLAPSGMLAFHKSGDNMIQMVDFVSQTRHQVTIPEVRDISTIQAIDWNTWLLTDAGGFSFILSWDNGFDNATVSPLIGEGSQLWESYFTPPSLSKGNDGNFKHLLVHPAHYIQKCSGVGNSESPLKIFSSPREDINGQLPLIQGICSFSQKAHSPSSVTAFQDNNGSLFLEVVSAKDQTFRQIAMKHHHHHATSVSGITGLCKLDNGNIVTLRGNGHLQFWELDHVTLQESLTSWKKMFGTFDQEKERLTLTMEGLTSTPKTGLDQPKHGKEDLDNTPHVGGNTWAGGTGGSDTAGLGGRGGPYRLDKGHPVHQISEEDKAMVSEEAKAKAREMAEKALLQQLKDIDMKPQEMKIYDRYLSQVAVQIHQLRVILDSIESRSHERVWLRHQASGELDDSKLIDSAVGEKLVYKKRGIEDTPFNSIEPQIKKIRFVMDVSGSMYRFNGQDARLERLLEVTTMIMEAFHGAESKYSYSIVGHSGDTPEIDFVEFGQQPQNAKERLRILQKMVAHSQYCMSGDHTVAATKKAIDFMAADLDDKKGSEGYVFVLSDANFRRYGIDPQMVGDLLMNQPGVEAHFIMIASLADEAEAAMGKIPSGRGHLCLNTSELPSLFKRMFASSFLRSSL